MRTTIEIDDKLMASVLKATGLPSKRAAVDEALRLLLRTRRLAAIRRLAGMAKWQGNLDESRRS